MNYYEEFGVLPSASAGEIRHAYKTLARVLHPDQFPDQNLKRLAELQMKRLSQILAVLTDPEERLRYNVRLKTPPMAPNRRVREAAPRQSSAGWWARPLAIGLCAWLLPLSGIILVGGGMVYYRTSAGTPNPGRSPEREVETRVATPAAAPPVLAESVHSGLAARKPEDLIAELKAARQELSVLRAEHKELLEQLGRSDRPLLSADPAPDPPVRPRPVVPDARSAIPVRADSTLAKTAVPAVSRLAGHWYYVPDSQNTSAGGVYVPEYIELRLIEDGATLRGRYHARYRVTDRAISPEVTFQFEGPGGFNAAQFPWTGAGDAKGDVALHLVSADQLEVTWNTRRLSADLHLASGTAQLIRQREHP